MLINIATPEWNEYEEEVNCSPQNEPATGRVRGKYSKVCVITLITALVLSLLFPLRRLLKAHYKFAVILDRYIST